MFIYLQPLELKWEKMTGVVVVVMMMMMMMTTTMTVMKLVEMSDYDAMKNRFKKISDLCDDNDNGDDDVII
jgi:hypothetical protein